MSIGGRKLTLLQLLQKTNMPMPPALLLALESPLSRSLEPNGMELDPTPETPAQAAVALPSRANRSNRAPRPSAFSSNGIDRTGMSRSSSSSSLGAHGAPSVPLRQPPPTELLIRIGQAFLPIALEYRPPHASAFTEIPLLGPDSRTADILDYLIQQMGDLYDHVTAGISAVAPHPGAVDFKRLISQCEANLRMVRQFAIHNAGERRIRSGQVAEALVYLARVLPEVVQVDSISTNRLYALSVIVSSME